MTDTPKETNTEVVLEDKSCFQSLEVSKRRLFFYLFFVISIILLSCSWGILIGEGTREGLTYCYLFFVLTFWFSTIFFYSIGFQLSIIKESPIMIVMAIVNLLSILLQFLNLYVFKVGFLSFVFIGAGTSSLILYFIIGFPLSKIFFCCCDKETENNEVKKENLV